MQPTFWPSTVTTGSTHRVVVELDQTGPGAVSTLWLDALDASAFHITATDIPFSTNLDITAIAMRQANIGAGAGTELVDNLLVGTTFADVAVPAANSWTDGSDKWETDTNWSFGVAPSSSQNAVLITKAGNNTVTIDATTSGSFPSTMMISNLMVKAPLNNTNTLFLNDAGLATPLDILNGLSIGTNGVLIVTNSSLTVDGLLFGSNSLDGTFVLNTGAITTTNLTTYIGAFGVGQMTVSNGTWLANDVYVANADGSRGTLTLAGGTNTFSDFLVVGYLGTGTLWVTGGRLTVTNVAHYVGYLGVGQMIVSNSTCLIENVYAGTEFGSQGTLTLAGGAITAGTLVDVGVGGAGALWVTGGQLTANTGTIRVGDNGGAVGQMTMSNGMVVANDVSVGDLAGSQGTLTVAGGTNLLSGELIMGRLANATGMVWVTGGQLVVTNNDGTVVGEAGAGQMTVSNGTVLLRDVYVGFAPSYPL
jgi:T5SS/PEP-CTERM-associated repeat protein